MNKEDKEYQKRQQKYDEILKEEKQKYTFRAKLSKLRFSTYTKTLVAIIIAVCLLDLQFTYALAFLGRDQVAESLSTSLCTTILGVAFVYMVRAYFDTKAERSMDTNSDSIGESIKSKVSSFVEEAINEDDEKYGL